MSIQSIKDDASAGIDSAFALGAASVGSVPLFTQADLDEAVKSATDPLNLTIAGLQSQVDGIPSQIATVTAALKVAVKALIESESEDEKTKVDSL